MRFLSPIKAGLIIFAVSYSCAAFPAADADNQKTLTLSTAIALTLEHYPQLKVFTLKQQALENSRLTASLRPEFELGFEAENFAGNFNEDNGNENDSGNAEYTLSISSVIEMGGKREARLALVDAQAGFVESKHKAYTLDVLADLTMQFVKVIQLQEKARIAEEMLALSSANYLLVGNRSQAGAAPEADVLRAKALLVKSRIALSEQRVLLAIEREQLAVFWLHDNSPKTLSGNLYHFHKASTFQHLYQLLLANPAMEVYASDARVQAAKVTLEKTRGQSNLTWQLGLRQLENSDETGLVAAFSFPLGTKKRNRGELAGVLLEEKEILLEKELAQRKFKAQLYAAYAQRDAAITSLEFYDQELLPALRSALKQTQSAYESGRYSYTEWMSVQTELFAAELTKIDIATQAQFATVMIEQLIAQPLRELEAGYPQ